MTTAKPLIELEAYIDGECSLEDSLRMKAELDRNPELAASAAQLASNGNSPRVKTP